MEELQKVIDEILCKDFLSETTHKYVRKNTVKMRLLEKIMNLLDLSNVQLQMYFKNNSIYVHPQCSLALEKNIQSLSLSNEEINLMKGILSQDYHEKSRLEKFSNMLKEKAGNHKDLIHALNIIYAVDGYNGSNYENYVQFLKFSLKEKDGNPTKDVLELHVKAIRHLYEKYGPSLNPKTVFKAVWNAYEVIDELDLTKEYIDLVGVKNLDVLKPLMNQRIEIKTEILIDMNKD